MKSKWVTVVLCISIAANLVLGGFVLGQGMKRPPQFGSDPVRAFPRWMRQLPSPRREELRPYVREHFRAMRPHLKGLHARHGALQEALRAEPYDHEALNAALATLRRDLEHMHAQGNAAFADFVAALSAEERRALADDIAQPPRRRDRRGGHDRRAPARPSTKG